MSSVVRVRPATPDDAAAVSDLAERASAEAQSPALNEQTLLALRAFGGESSAAEAPPTVLVAVAEDQPIGALAVHQRDDPISAEIVLPDGPYRDDAGRALLDSLAGIASTRPEVSTRLWAHGRLSPVGPLAQSRGYPVQRLLARLVRPGDLPAPAATVPAGVRIAPFRPGIDDAAWLAVNAAAFADHPEQGQWTARDLQDRIDSDWFDAEGFLLGWLDQPQQGIESGPDGLIGFHWTKTEPDPRHPGTDCGEVYVIGVWPGAAGLHLGSSLLSAGLAHLRSRGVARVYLYVDGDNDRARSLYEHVGFVEDDVDICYDIVRNAGS